MRVQSSHELAAGQSEAPRIAAPNPRFGWRTRFVGSARASGRGPPGGRVGYPIHAAVQQVRALHAGRERETALSGRAPSHWGPARESPGGPPRPSGRAWRSGAELPPGAVALPGPVEDPEGGARVAGFAETRQVRVPEELAAPEARRVPPRRGVANVSRCAPSRSTWRSTDPASAARADLVEAGIVPPPPTEGHGRSVPPTGRPPSVVEVRAGAFPLAPGEEGREAHSAADGRDRDRPPDAVRAPAERVREDQASGILSAVRGTSTSIGGIVSPAPTNALARTTSRLRKTKEIDTMWR